MTMRTLHVCLEVRMMIVMVIATLIIGKPSADFSDRPWERWQLAGLEVSTNGLRHGGDGIVASLLQGAEHAHQDGLGFGSVLAAVGIAVLPRNHSRSDLTLAVVVVEGNLGM